MICLPLRPRLSHLSSPTGYEETLTRLAAILAKHFADTRIVGTGEVLTEGWGWLGSWLLPVKNRPGGFKAHSRHELRQSDLSQQTFGTPSCRPWQATCATRTPCGLWSGFLRSSE